jgi:hypothetical protein
VDCSCDNRRVVTIPERVRMEVVAFQAQRVGVVTTARVEMVAFKAQL